MAASQGIIGKGTVLAFAALGSTTFAAIAELVEITPPEIEIEDVEMTSMESPDDTREYIPGLIEPGETEFTINYHKTAAAAVHALANRVKRKMKITYPDNSTEECEVFLTSIGKEVPVDDRMQVTGTLKNTTKPVFTAAT